MKKGCQRKPEAYNESMTKDEKIYWHANISSGGTLSIGLDYEGALSKSEKEEIIADVISACHKTMEKEGYIPFSAKMMSSRDISKRFGKSRQYWEKLLSEGKILYKETSAGRITTDLWIQGYIDEKKKVDKYVKDVKKVLRLIEEREFDWDTVNCPVCGENTFNYAVNTGGSTNGICRNPSCDFHIHTTS